MKNNVIKIKDILVPVVQDFSTTWDNGDYIGEDGKKYKVNLDAEGKNVIGTDADGNQIVRPIENRFSPIPFTYENEYKDCRTLYLRGVNIEELDNKFSTDDFKLVEIFFTGKDNKTGKDVFNIVWQRPDYVRVGVMTNGEVGFDVRSEGFSLEELQKYIDIANYLKANYKED